MTFIATIQGIRDGSLVAKLNDELQDVVASVIEHGKSGALTLKIKVEKNGDNAVTLTTDVTAKQAQATVGSAIFFADQGGNLHRRDPRQGDLLDPAARDKKEQN